MDNYQDDHDKNEEEKYQQIDEVDNEEEQDPSKMVSE